MAEKKTQAQVTPVATTTEIRDGELDQYVKLLYNNNRSIKSLEENQKRLKEVVMAKMDMLKSKRYSVLAESDKEKPVTVIMVENTKVSYDAEKVKKVCPEAIEKILTVDGSNMEAFKELLKSYGLNGKQVNELVKVMNLKQVINEKELSIQVDQGKITAEQLAEIGTLNVTSRYIRFV